MTDRVRVFRILKYEGTRKWVEKTLSNSIQGIREVPNKKGTPNTIHAQTIEVFPEVLEEEP